MPIKILYLITELNVGGAEKVLARLLTRLNRQRFEPIVACLYGGDGQVADEIRKLDVPVIDLGMVAKWRWDAFVRLYQLLYQERPLILHCWMFHANIAGRLLGKLALVPIIITSRRIGREGNTRELLNRWTAQLDDKVIAVCESARQNEIKITRVPPYKVISIYNGIDVATFLTPDAQVTASVRQAFEIPKESLLLGSVGRLAPQKGFADLLIALKYVQGIFPDIRLLLVGDGPLRESLYTQVKRLNLLDAVKFAGIQANIPEILAALDIFVLPSLWEGMPNAIIEAMAARLPVIATAVDGSKEVIVSGKNGLLVPPGNPAALAEAMTKLLNNSQLRRQMGQAGFERVSEHFTVQQMVERTEALYQELITDKLNLKFERELQ